MAKERRKGRREMRGMTMANMAVRDRNTLQTTLKEERSGMSSKRFEIDSRMRHGRSRKFQWSTIADRGPPLESEEGVTITRASRTPAPNPDKTRPRFEIFPVSESLNAVCSSAFDPILSAYFSVNLEVLWNLHPRWRRARLKKETTWLERASKVDGGGGGCWRLREKGGRGREKEGDELGERRRGEERRKEEIWRLDLERRERRKECVLEDLIAVVAPALPLTVDLSSGEGFDVVSAAFGQVTLHHTRSDRKVFSFVYLQRRSAADNTFTYEVLIVDDGSKDRTSKVAFNFVRKYKIDNVRVMLLGRNHGQGEAIRKGMLHSRGELLLMLDADGATMVTELEKLETQVLGSYSDGI
ncbi:uncharacterized protein A4U43_C07F4440 [Asparagus officinalis]|uniref:Glycosyltransferase 2-like domain-containing protein n=1 Tax=Asparagus officinalis TaxID=4686 RepID=A0A5P1EBB1_ASPOF|nr:uncharacterized protein A4U43_C07F4440 [Asparagus officinalis]